MARQVRNAKLDTPSARAKLAARKSPYWMVITRGCALGYRRSAEGGRWLAKFVGDGVRQETTLGPSNDALDADGVTALDFAQAQERARKWFSQVGREAAGEAGHAGPYKVADAARDYMEWFRSHGKSVRETEYKVNVHILPALGKLEVAKLAPAKVRKWHRELAETPARIRTPQGEAQRYREASDDPEPIRKRRSTANRVLKVLKAMLNHAWRENKVSSDESWRRVKPFKRADKAKVRYLTADECKRLVNACDQEFQPLVQAALFTGCRYGELTRLSVSDFNPDAGTVAVQETKTGEPRHVVLDEDGQAFFESMTAGRLGSAPMLERAKGGRWGTSHQKWPLRKACKRANIDPVVGFHILRHTSASHLVMNGAPLQVVAHNLGHSDTRMVDKHYAHLQPSYVADAIRAAAPKLGIADKGNVVPLKRKS